MVPHRGYSYQRDLLPSERELIETLGLSRAEYFDFLDNCYRASKERAPGYELIPDIQNGPVWADSDKSGHRYCVNGCGFPAGAKAQASNSNGTAKALIRVTLTAGGGSPRTRTSAASRSWQRLAPSFR